MSGAWTFSGICWLAAALLVISWGLWETRRPRTPEPTRQYPPPVPPSRPRITQEDIDATWLAVWPAGDDDQIALRFEQIAEANHFHDFLPGEWV